MFKPFDLPHSEAPQEQDDSETVKRRTTQQNIPNFTVAINFIVTIKQLTKISILTAVVQKSGIDLIISFRLS